MRMALDHTLKDTEGLCPYFIERTQVQIREDLRIRSHGKATQGLTDYLGAQALDHGHSRGLQEP